MTQHDLLASIETFIQDADQADCARLIGDLEHLKVLAWGKMLAGSGPASREAERFLTVRDTATRLNISEYRVYELCRTKKLKAERIGKSVRVKPSNLADYLAKQGA